MSLFTSKKLDNQSISNALINNFILVKVDEDIDRLDIKQHKIDIFTTKLRTYKSAIVLIALLSEEQKDKRYSQLRAVFEQSLIQNEDNLLEIKNAMIDLNVLLFSDSKKELSWSMKWFQQIEIEEFNPVRLMLLSLIFIKSFTMIVNLLRKEFKPF